MQAFSCVILNIFWKTKLCYGKTVSFFVFSTAATPAVCVCVASLDTSCMIGEVKRAVAGFFKGLIISWSCLVTRLCRNMNLTAFSCYFLLF